MPSLKVRDPCSVEYDILNGYRRFFVGQSIQAENLTDPLEQKYDPSPWKASALTRGKQRITAPAKCSGKAHFPCSYHIWMNGDTPTLLRSLQASTARQFRLVSPCNATVMSRTARWRTPLHWQTPARLLRLSDAVQQLLLWWPWQWDTRSVSPSLSQACGASCRTFRRGTEVPTL